MKHSVPQIVAAALLVLVCSPIAANAQSETAPPARPASPTQYDIAQELTLSGTASSIIPTATTGMLNGAHLILTTASGSVDVSLGVFALLGKGALSVKPGEQVEVKGVLRDFNSSQVLLARTVKVGDHTYTIRNEHGIALPPPARERLQQQTSQSGDSL